MKEYNRRKICIQQLISSVKQIISHRTLYKVNQLSALETFVISGISIKPRQATSIMLTIERHRQNLISSHGEDMPPGCIGCLQAGYSFDDR